MQKMCSPAESSIKCFFLGPKAENAEALSKEVFYILERWFAWRRERFPSDGKAIPESERSSIEYKNQQQLFHTQIETVMARFEKEIPKFSPRYIGHMFSEFSLPALLGHFITLLHNPNNVSKESSYIGVQFEHEAIRFLCEMLDYPDAAVGHFTSGGTIANLEFLVRAKHRWLTWLSRGWDDADLSFMQASHAGWSAQTKSAINLHELSEVSIARKIEERYHVPFTGPVLLVPENKHYSWIKGSHYFGLGKDGLVTIELDEFGRLSMASLKEKVFECLAQKRPILGVVSVCGSTELGTIDAVSEVNEFLALLKTNKGIHIWHHVDAAYGGFFATLRNHNTSGLNEEQTKSLQDLGSVDSITLDPHKLGYVPYASGAFLCKNPQDYFIHLFNAPYVQFDHELDRGLFTIEGSRSAAGAVSTWLAATCVGFHADGYGKLINRTIGTCHAFEQALRESGLPLLFLGVPKTNILCIAIGSAKDSLSTINLRTFKVFDRLNALNQEKETFFISKTVFSSNFRNLILRLVNENNLQNDSDRLVVLRLTMMNPFLISQHNKVDYIGQFIHTLRGLLDSANYE